MGERPCFDPTKAFNRRDMYKMEAGKPIPKVGSNEWYAELRGTGERVAMISENIPGNFEEEDLTDEDKKAIEGRIHEDALNDDKKIRPAAEARRKMRERFKIERAMEDAETAAEKGPDKA